MASPKKPYDQLTTLSKLHFLWNSIHSLLDWDQETYMPSYGIDFRSQQTSAIASHTHKLKTSRKFGKLLGTLINLETGKILDPSLSPAQKAASIAWRRDYLKNTKIPSSFIKTFLSTTSKACFVWARAKNESNFKKFAPYLEKIIRLSQRKADYLGYQNHPYDALLDLYEPETTTANLSSIFDSLKTGLQTLLQKIMEKHPPHAHFLKQTFDPSLQFDFGKTLLLAMGFNPNASRLDFSSHPFCLPICSTDIRMTTRIHENDLMPNIFSVLHEGGHGLYAQGLPEQFYGTPLGEIASVGIDESQSRFWETRIGKSRPFWQHFFPKLQEKFPLLHTISLDQFYAAINVVTPSFIRVEADEVTYTLHVILRFEIEKLLLEEKIKAKEVPELWNQKMKELLGVTPPNDALGCLQDIHWAFGNIGYFPTYILGNLYASQFFEQFTQEFPDWDHRVSQGDLTFVRTWLNTHIHQWGRQFTPHELIKKVTGKSLTEKPFLNYLDVKYHQLNFF